MKRLENAMKEIKTEKKNKYIELVTKLDSISPLKTLIRGYSLTEKNGQIPFYRRVLVFKPKQRAWLI